MEANFSYMNFIARLSNCSGSMSVEDWIKFLEEDFNNVKHEKYIRTELVGKACETIRIEFEEPIISAESILRKPVSSTAILMHAVNLFFIIIPIGENHETGSNALKLLKGTPDLFINNGGGRFTTVPHNIYVSFEEDEFEDYYLIASTHKELLDFDPLFNHTRRFIKGY